MPCPQRQQGVTRRRKARHGVPRRQQLRPSQGRLSKGWGGIEGIVTDFGCHGETDFVR